MKCINTNEFQKHEFAELLKAAKGSRTQREYADDAEVGYYYLNHYMNEKTDTPPRVSTILKLAEAAYRPVTYSELLNAAGYNPSEYADANELQEPATLSKKFYTTIINYIKKSSIKVSKIKGSDKEFYSILELNLKSACVPDWRLIYIPFESSTPVTDRQLQSQVFLYGKISGAAPIHSKISLVTDNKQIFIYLKYLSPCIFRQLTSVLLINPYKHVIVKEEYLANPNGFSNVELTSLQF